MSGPVSTAVWAKGDAYDPYVGRWSRAVAREFLPWLGVQPGRRWVDVGCGTGALTETILTGLSPTAVVGIDPSNGFVAYARELVRDPRARFQIGDAQGLPVPTAAFDGVVAGLVLNFVPDPAAVVAEMARAACAGGVVGAYVWDYAGGMELMRWFWEAAVALDPAAEELDEGRRFTSVCHPDKLADLWRGAGLRGVKERAVEVPTPFRDFDDYWTPFLGGQGAAPGYLMTLTEDHRVALRERLRAQLPVAADGSIRLVARAWAVRGERG